MAAPYRIMRSGAVRRNAVPDHPVAAAEPGSTELQGYLERLMKMIPAEVIGLYLVGSGIIPTGQSLALTIWTAVCLAGVIFLRAYGTADPAANKAPDWAHVIISSISFLIWVYSIGGFFAAYGVAVPYIGSLLVLAWTFFVPIFYKGPAE